MNSAYPFPDHSSDSDSRDCIDVIVDAPGDNTVRLMDPNLKELILAERARRARLMEMMKQEQSEDKPANETDAEGKTD